MNVIEQTIEPKNGAIDLHVDVPAEWEGYVLKVTVERTEAKVETPKKTNMSRFRGMFNDMSAEEKADMDQQLTQLRSEWDRDTF
ncbi:MAG: hypothetical protein H7319_00920 [Spirosoma sp.]|nr:hypothetical protein [Spirosoma sp.]